MAARYDITGEDLGRFVLGRQSITLGGVACLDHRADLVLEHALAAAARVERARIGKLRVVSDDGSASCWHRDAPAWCPECIQGDLARHGEVHGRSIWRLGCCVLCPVHDLLLDHICCRCVAQARCHFRPGDGRLRLTCDVCGRRVDPASPYPHATDGHGTGAFGILPTPQIVGLVRNLQGDVMSVLAGRSPIHGWGPLQPAAELMAASSALTIAIIWSAGLRIEPRVDLFALASGQVGAAAYLPVTLALLTPYAAFGVMALIATFLEGLRPASHARHSWRPEGTTVTLDVSSFLGWLTEPERASLHRAAAAWGGEACHAVRTAIGLARKAKPPTRRR